MIEDDNTCHVNCCAGDKGRTGPKGDTGPQGEEGPKGDKGPFLYFNITFVDSSRKSGLFKVVILLLTELRDG